MNTDHKQGWEALKQAKQAFTAWARSRGVTVERIEHVATFEPWDKSTEIHIFFLADSDLQRFKAEGTLLQIEQKYRELLSDAQYRQDRWPVVFQFDTHENVVKNYKGNYGYRLR
jgi:hypothetical protein